MRDIFNVYHTYNRVKTNIFMSLMLHGAGESVANNTGDISIGRVKRVSSRVVDTGVVGRKNTGYHTNPTVLILI